VHSLFPRAIEALFQPLQKARADQILADINVYLQLHHLKADSLVDFQAQGHLSEYLKSDDYEDLFFNINIADPYNHDQALLMAFIADGGRIDDLIHNCIHEFEPKYLIDQLSKRSPQEFIATAGLIPGPGANRLYNGMVHHLIEQHAPVIEEHVSSGREHKTVQYTHPLFHQIAQAPSLTGTVARYDWPLDDTFSRTLTAKAHEFDAGAYHDLMIHVLAEDHGEQEFEFAEGEGMEGHYRDPLHNKMLNTLFYADAYRQLENSSDTATVLMDMRQKAESLLSAAGADEVGADVFDDAVEQMVCCAFTAHPEHFAAAGFGVKNLVGIDPKRSPTRQVRNVLSGPLAVFSESNAASSRESFAHLRAYLHALEPEFTPDAMIEHQGLNHERIENVIEAEKAYVAAIVPFVMKPDTSRDDLGTLAYQISKANAFHHYALETLAPIYFQYLYQVPLRQADGTLAAKGQFQADNSRHIFRELFTQCPGMKEALIAHMESKTGWTHDHLILTGLDYRSAPNVLKAMDLRDQGSVFSSDIGA
jgi:hypothetical protein